MVRADGFELLLDGSRDIKHKARIRDPAKVRRVVVEQPLGVQGITKLEGPPGPRIGGFGHLDLAELRVKASILHTSRHGSVVRMRIDVKGRKDHLRLPSSDHSRERVAVLDRVLNETVGEIEQPTIDLAGCVPRQHLERVRGFLLADLGRSERGGLAVGDIEDQDIVSLVHELDDGATHAQFLIIWMGTDDEDACHAFTPCVWTGVCVDECERLWWLN